MVVLAELQDAVVRVDPHAPADRAREVRGALGVAAAADALLVLQQQDVPVDVLRDLKFAKHTRKSVLALVTCFANRYYRNESG